MQWRNIKYIGNVLKENWQYDIEIQWDFGIATYAVQNLIKVLRKKKMSLGKNKRFINFNAILVLLYDRELLKITSSPRCRWDFRNQWCGFTTDHWEYYWMTMWTNVKF